MKLVLHLTKDCNLRCIYCYAPSKTDTTMSVETAKKGIDLIVGLSPSSACISYFGGEPLLKFDMIKELTEYALELGEKKDKRISFRMSTNGLLFTEEILSFCRDHNILFALSMDGNRDIQDRQRIFPGGGGSFDALNSKLDMILHYNPRTVVASVITPCAIPHLADSMEFLWERGIRFIAHNPDYTYPTWMPSHLNELEIQYRRMADFYVEKTQLGAHFIMSVFDEKLKTLMHKPIELGGQCNFGAQKVSVAPDGRLFPCVRFVSDREDAKPFCIGDVDTGFSTQREKLIALNKSGRTNCGDCEHLGRCGSHCGCRNWAQTGSITESGALLCAHERMLIPIADEIGNFLWDSKNQTFMRKHYKLDKHFQGIPEYDFD